MDMTFGNARERDIENMVREKHFAPAFAKQIMDSAQPQFLDPRGTVWDSWGGGKYYWEREKIPQDIPDSYRQLTLLLQKPRTEVLDIQDETYVDMALDGLSFEHVVLCQRENPEVFYLRVHGTAENRNSVRYGACLCLSLARLVANDKDVGQELRLATSAWMLREWFSILPQREDVTAKVMARLETDARADRLEQDKRLNGVTKARPTPAVLARKPGNAVRLPAD